MNKMVINRLEKLFVTTDAVSILNELEVQHPAARIIVLAAQMQEKQIGDNTNTVIILSASFLEQALQLLDMVKSSPFYYENFFRGSHPLKLLLAMNLHLENLRSFCLL